MILLGLVSSYKEGALVQGAIRSLVPWCDHTLVYEGQAGKPIEGVPESDFGAWAKHDKVTLHRGRWRTDARKRQAMLEASRAWESPVWGIIVDADEVLYNGEYLRDWLQRLEYEEEVYPEKRFQGRPIRLMELDGGLSWVRARVLRLDRMQSYEISTAVFTTTDGHRTGQGNPRDLYSAWAEPRALYFEQDVNLVRAPIPTEPFIVHRSALRHPERDKVRMHQQEAEEFEKAQAREAAAAA